MTSPDTCRCGGTRFHVTFPTLARIEIHRGRPVAVTYQPDPLGHAVATVTCASCGVTLDRDDILRGPDGAPAADATPAAARALRDQMASWTAVLPVVRVAPTDCDPTGDTVTVDTAAPLPRPHRQH